MNQWNLLKLLWTDGQASKCHGKLSIHNKTLGTVGQLDTTKSKSFFIFKIYFMNSKQNILNEPGKVFFIDCETDIKKFSVLNELLFIQIAEYDKQEFKNLLYSDIQKTTQKKIHIYNAVEATEKTKQYFKNILLNPRNRLVFFNAPFDCGHLLKWLYPVQFYPGMDVFTYSQDFIKAQIWDLYLILKVIHPGYKKNSLENWAQRLYNIKLDKSLQTSFSKGMSMTPEFKKYMEKDVKILILIFAQLQRERYLWLNTHTGKKIYAFKFYCQYLKPLIYESIDAYLRGLNIDFKETQANLLNIDADLSRLNEIFKNRTGYDPISIKSGKSAEKPFKAILSEKIFNLLPRTETGQLQISFKILKIFLKKNQLDIPALQTFIEILEKRDQLRRFTKLLKSIYRGADTNRLFFSYDLYGAETGRITTRDYPIQGSPAVVKQNIVPQSGNIFIVADVSQEEIRIIAEMSKDPTLLKVFEKKLDFHSYTGAILNKQAYNDFLKMQETELFKKRRFLAKILNLGLQYGMGPKTLHNTLEKGGVYQPYKTTYKQWNTWQKTYKGIVKYQQSMVNHLWTSQFQKKAVFASYTDFKKNYFYITSLLGRVKRDSDLDKGWMSYEKFSNIKWFVNEYANYPIQATGADFLSQIWSKLSKRLKGKARIVMVVFFAI